jgi:hypothetical protein
MSLRTLCYALSGASVVVLLVGGVSRLAWMPIAGIQSRAFFGLAVVLQLYAMTALLLELVGAERR